MTHRFKIPTRVRLDQQKRPQAFTMGEAWVHVAEVIDRWILDTLWWSKDGRVCRHYFTIMTSWYGIYELYWQEGAWYLSGRLD